MSEETKTEEEPSIEEILDSIRQIISDDDDEAPADSEGGEDSEGGDATVPDEPLDQSAIDDIDFDSPVAEAEPEEPLDQSAIDDIDFDSPAPVDAEPEAEPEPEADDGDDVLELTDRVDAEESMDVDLKDEDVVPDPVPEVEPEPEVEPAPEPPEDEDSDIFTNRVEIAAADAISKLVKKTAVEHNGITLEDIVRTELKPLLRVWLDNNLPSLIERLVAEELERVSKRILED